MHPAGDFPLTLQTLARHSGPRGALAAAERGRVPMRLSGRITVERERLARIESPKAIAIKHN